MRSLLRLHGLGALCCTCYVITYTRYYLAVPRRLVGLHVLFSQGLGLLLIKMRLASLYRACGTLRVCSVPWIWLRWTVQYCLPAWRRGAAVCSQPGQAQRRVYRCAAPVVRHRQGRALPMCAHQAVVRSLWSPGFKVAEVLHGRCCWPSRVSPLQIPCKKLQSCMHS